MTDLVRFHVPGVPAPQGSKVRNRWGGVRESNPEMRPWRATVTWHAIEARSGRPALEGPVSVHANFTFPRPKAHLRADGTVKPGAGSHKATRPDLDKLLRALLDGMKDAGVYRDDGQVAYISANKHYGEPGVHVEVRPLRSALKAAA